MGGAPWRAGGFALPREVVCLSYPPDRAIEAYQKVVELEGDPEASFTKEATARLKAVGAA